MNVSVPPDRRRPITWPCMVCGVRRADSKIDVYTERSENRMVSVNIRHCNDNLVCVSDAKDHPMLAIVREQEEPDDDPK